MKNSDKIGTVRKQKRLCFAADETLIAQIDAAARATRVGRSFVIREVLRGWVAEKGIAEP
jgi:Ribbon-helix-helix protein, copG family